MTIAFPHYRVELTKLVKEDQAEIRSHYQKLKSLHSQEEKEKLNNQLNIHCHARAVRMLKILHDIKEPSISNIGREGSEAISVLALHSYLDEMKEVLAAYQIAYERNPENIYK